jgi:protease-4
MKLAKETKPVIVSMGDYAASGGYYISAPADTILAQTNTITGSIGIFMTLFTAEELIEDKIGIHYDVVKTGEFADILSLNRSLKETEKMKLQNLVDEGYGQFLSLVAEGRSLDSGYVDSIGQGRVWSGQRAMELGLVDLEGGLDDAIAIAAEKAGLEDYKLMELPVLKTGLQKIMSELQMAKAKEDILKDEFGEFYEQWKQVKKVKSWNEPQARMEFELNIN